MASVQRKVPSALVCVHRPLKPGEIPKRPDQTTIYESTGEFNPDFLTAMKTITTRVTVKHDGTCCLLHTAADGCQRLYKRKDVRPNKKNRTPPAGAIPAFVDASETVQFYWIPVTGTTDPSSQAHLAAITSNGYNLIVPDTVSGYKITDSGAPDGTYELVGPKVQNNRYQLPSDQTVSVTLTKKGTDRLLPVPKHYLIPHGAFELDYQQLDYDQLRQFVIDACFEGVVFHLADGQMFKINRGHLQAEPAKKTVYKICL